MIINILFIAGLALWFFGLFYWFIISWNMINYRRFVILGDSKAKNDDSQYNYYTRHYYYISLCLFVLLLCFIMLFLFYRLSPTDFINDFFVNFGIKSYGPFLFKSEQFSISQFCKISVIGDVHFYYL